MTVPPGVRAINVCHNTQNGEPGSQIDWARFAQLCDVFIGEPMLWSGNKEAYMTQLNARMKALADEGHFPPWQ